MAGVKQRNFRLDDETVEKFSNLCEEMGVTQAQGFAHVIQIAELERAKGLITNRETEIEDFQQKVKSLIAAYLYSLELSENAEARVKESFITALESKDAVILDYQKRVEGLTGQLQDAQQSIEQQQILQADLESTAADLISLQERYDKDLAEKNRLNDLLADKVNSLTAELEGYDILQKKFSAIHKQNEEYRVSLQEQETASKEAMRGLESSLNDTIRSLQHELKDAQRDAEISAERVRMDLEKKHSDELRELERKHNETMMQLMVQVQDFQEEKAKLAIELAQIQNAAGKEKSRFGK